MTTASSTSFSIQFREELTEICVTTECVVALYDPEERNLHNLYTERLTGDLMMLYYVQKFWSVEL